MKQVLTKTDYILGLQCPRYLWLTKHEPDKIRKATAAEEFMFRQGDAVGKLACSLFPDGIDVYEPDYKINVVATKEALSRGKPLFEAGFLFENCYARADILVPSGDGWDMIEVKMGTDAKDVNVHDAAFQKYVLENSGITIKRCFIKHINNQYVRNGELELDKLFVKKDITAEVAKEQGKVKERISKLGEVIALQTPPKPGMFNEKLFSGHHDCLDGCLDLPANHIFCLYRGKKLACELYEAGIMHIKDIPLHVKLNGKQQIQRDCEMHGIPFVDKEKIAQFISSLKQPLYFMDFETFYYAIPLFDGLKPYNQVPFQFSVHVLDNELMHHEFLYEGNADPRVLFASELKKVIGTQGSIFVYFQSFEVSRLKDLAAWFPEHKEWIDNVMSRIVNLYTPFGDFYYYNSKQEGSASLKVVLPAVTGKSYEGMDIADGGSASAAFYKMAYGECSSEEKQKIRKALLEYCCFDTMAEVWILERLRELVRVEKEVSVK